ncbi:MAG: RNase adaptor protein RapZ, partial [Firmicutes bacterium]|nr:RNase adaptor protein RapZ [Bacillota bacterium]
MAPISKEIIAKERELLAGLRGQATYIIDTSFLKVAEFNSQLDSLFQSGTETESFLIDIQSFGFKRGVPQEADIIMDVRFIPNPYYVPSLKHLTGNNKKVSQYVLKHAVAQEFIESMHTMLARLIPCYVKEGKYSLRIAFGCTGGQHRSVAVANEMARIFREEGRRVTLEHREL